MKIKIILLGILISLLSTGCVSPNKRDYTNFINADPHSILVVVSDSFSNDINAVPAVLSSAVLPLSEAGYYVLPVTMVNETFRYNGVTGIGELKDIPLQKYKEVFGADAIMFLTIKEYQSHYAVLDSYFQVEVSAQLVDVDTGVTLWSTTSVANNASRSDDLLFNIVAALVKLVVNEVGELGQDVAIRNSYYMFAPNNQYIKDPILAGPYSPYYRHDKVLKK
jgi:hypothetical protein